MSLARCPSLYPFQSQSIWVFESSLYCYKWLSSILWCKHNVVFPWHHFVCARLVTLCAIATRSLLAVVTEQSLCWRRFWYSLHGGVVFNISRASRAQRTWASNPGVASPYQAYTTFNRLISLSAPDRFCKLVRQTPGWRHNNNANRSATTTE